MPQAWRSRNDSRYSISTPVIGRLAKKQWGVLSLPQLADLGYNRMAVSRLVARGYLVRLYPAVYAVGHAPLRIEGRLLAALFHAGDGSALSHTTAAWWWRLIEAVPTTIHISTSHRPTTAKGLKTHRPRQIEAVRERGLAVTTVERTLIDVASMRNTMTLRSTLAEADHRNLLDPPSLTAQLRSGQPGARALRQALATHLPELATTDSELEIQFLLLVERAGLPIPETNAYVEDLKVDAFWPAHRLVVELDGHATHANPVANENDRARELKLRAAGYRVVRYTWEQVTRSPDEVVADLRRLLAA
jgi:hypothetical protein